MATPEEQLLEERVKRIHAEERQAKAEARLVAAGNDRLEVLGQLKASQLLDRSKVRECMREIGGHLGELQQRASVLGAIAGQLDALQVAWEEVNVVIGAAAPSLVGPIAALLASRDDLAALASAADQAGNRWCMMPRKERDDLAAEDEE